MDKLNRLLDTIEKPEDYSQADIETMLQDPETRETLALLDKLKSSLINIPTPDIENEWKMFENRHRLYERSRWKQLRDFVSRNIAASISISIISVTAMATIVSISIGHLNGADTEQSPGKITTLTDTALSSHRQDSIKTHSGEESVTGKIIIFNDETLENIITIIAAHYGYTVIFDDDAPKSLRLYFRWNQDMDAEDVIARINNFEQINVSIYEKTFKVN